MHPATLLLALAALFPVRGRVVDAVTGAPLAGVQVTAAGRAGDALTAAALTDADGRFALDLAGPARLELRRAGYAARSFAAADADTLVVLRLVPEGRALEAVTVTATRGDAALPIARSTLSREEIERRYAGQDAPVALAAEPSVTAFSESGSQWNYSYIRLRGIDQSRINMTLDGVPLNEPEDQQVYFSDFPDFANSVESVQIQRGVGTSTYGVASFGGAVNFESPSLATGRRGAELQVGAGSYGARRVSAEYESGMLPGKVAFYGRLSQHQGDGYRYGSGSWANGGFLSGAWFGGRDIVKLTVSTGLERNGQAYTPVRPDQIARDRRFNPIFGVGSGGDTVFAGDRFRESFAILQHTRRLGESSSLATTAYGFRAGGFFDYPSGEVDAAGAATALRFRLASRWGGAMVAWSWRRGAASLDAGVHAAAYSRDHASDALAGVDWWPGYANRGYKTEGSAFTKAAYELGRLTLFADGQLRQARFRYRPDADAGVAGEPSVRWTLASPKAGLTFRLAPALQAYASYGAAEREPTRVDMFGGQDDLAGSDVDALLPLTRVRPERVRDLEAGVRWARAGAALSVNGYAMEFTDEIARTGLQTELGADVRRNVGRSYRRGLELDASWRPLPRLALRANATASRNRIREFTDERTGTTHRGVAPALTPGLIAGHGLMVDAARWLALTADGRYQSRSHLAPLGDDRLTLPPSYVSDLGAELRLGGQSLLVQLRNALDRDAYAAGDVRLRDGAYVPRYFVLAPRNVMVTGRVKF